MLDQIYGDSSNRVLPNTQPPKDKPTIAMIQIVMWLLNTITGFLKPTSTDPSLRFRERNIRFFSIAGGLLFATLFVVSTIRNEINLAWYGTIAGILIMMMLAVRLQRIVLAGRVATLIPITILLDNSVAYWSPGTVLMGLLFSFAFLLILPFGQEFLLAVAFNLAVYIGVLLLGPQQSTIPEPDFYAQPETALFATIVAHVLIIGMGYYIRIDQAERDKTLIAAEAERAAVLRRAFSNFSHDLRTPLTSLRMQAYLLQQMSTNDEQARIVERLDRSVVQLEHIIVDIIDFSRLDAGIEYHPAPLNLPHLMQLVIDELQADIEQKALTVHFDTTVPKHAITGDTQYIKRAFYEVLDNAVYHTPTGGEITITMQLQPSTMRIVIEDNGVGIASAKIPFVFDSFFRVDEARTSAVGRIGMGLTVVKRIMDLHNGNIELESAPGCGTRCILQLPLEKRTNMSE